MTEKKQKLIIDQDFVIARALVDIEINGKFAKCGHLAKMHKLQAQQLEKSGRVDSNSEAVEYARGINAELTDFTASE